MRRERERTGAKLGEVERAMRVKRVQPSEREWGRSTTQEKEVHLALDARGDSGFGIGK